MLVYTIRRLLMLVPVLLGVSFLTFAIAKVTPGDPARQVLGRFATQEQLENFRTVYGLDDPLLVQYGNYVWNALHGDLGISYKTGNRVTEDIMLRFPHTFQLTVAAVFIASLMGISLGAIAAVTRSSWINISTMGLALVGLSIPSFWLAILLLIVFGVKLGWVSVIGGTGLKNLVLPAIAIAFSSFGTLTRLTRSSILEILKDDFVRTARAKGLTDRLVTLRHVLPNAMIPVVTVVGMQFAYLLGGAVFVEVVFSRYGLGRYAIQAISDRDFPAIQGMVLFTAAVVTLINLAVDLLYGYLDPRIRYD